MKRDEIFKVCAEKANGTVLSFPDRGPWGSSSYRGNFSGWIPASLIYRYGATSVSEIFAGSGTTSDVCKDLEIPYLGIDLNPNPIRSDIISMDILSDEELPDFFNQADIQILHPPYPGINGIHYANSMYEADRNTVIRDIQEMDWDKGMTAINRAIMRGFSAMSPGTYQAVVVGDIRSKNLGGFKSMFKDLVVPGKIEQVLIKMQHNTVSGRNTYSSKRNFFFIEHEYVLVIKKPTGYELAFVVPQNHSLDIRDSNTATWKDVVLTVLRTKGTTHLSELYDELEGHKKTACNPHWKEKIRQTLQQLATAGLVSHPEIGVWMAA